MNYTCVTGYLLKQSRKDGIIKNYFVSYPVPPRNFLKKNMGFLNTIVRYTCFFCLLVLLVKRIIKIINNEWHNII